MNENSGITIIQTYNELPDYPYGIYPGRDGEIVVSKAFPWQYICEGVYDERFLSESTKRIYEFLKTKDTSPKNLKEIFWYMGDVHGFIGPTYLETLSEKGYKPTLVACLCSKETKISFADRNNLPITWADCSGREKLSEIIRERLMGGRK